MKIYRFKPGEILIDADNTFLKYTILEQLGLGGMAEIYKVDFEGRTHVLKVMLPASDPDLKHKFEREAELLWRLNCQYVVKTTSFCRFLGHRIDRQHMGKPLARIPYFRMAFGGGTLRPVMKALATITNETERQALAGYILCELAHAVAYFERVGLVHCDLKPENILVSADGDLVCCDFSFAHVFRESHRFPATDFPHVPLGAGTMGYSAPECFSGAKVTPAADIYSLGIILLEVLAGKSIFQLDSRGRHLDASQFQTFIEDSQQHEAWVTAMFNAAALPEKERGIVHSCLHFQPGQRPQSAILFLKSLRDIFADNIATYASFSAFIATLPA